MRSLVRELTSCMPQKDGMRPKFLRPETKSPVAQPSLPLQFHPPSAPLSPMIRLHWASSDFQCSASVLSFGICMSSSPAVGFLPQILAPKLPLTIQSVPPTPHHGCSTPPATPAEEAPWLLSVTQLSPLQTCLKFSCSVLFLLLICPLTRTIGHVSCRTVLVPKGLLSLLGWVPCGSTAPALCGHTHQDRREWQGMFAGFHVDPSAPVSMTRATQSCAGIREPWPLASQFTALQPVPVTVLGTDEVLSSKMLMTDKVSPSRSLWSTERPGRCVSEWKRFPNKGNLMCGVEVHLGCHREQDGVSLTELSIRRAEMLHGGSEVKQGLQLFSH